MGTPTLSLRDVWRLDITQEYLCYPLLWSVLQPPTEDQEPPGGVFCALRVPLCYSSSSEVRILGWAAWWVLGCQNIAVENFIYYPLLFTIFFFVFYYEIFRVYRSFRLYCNPFLFFLFVSHLKNSNLFVPKNRKV